ncbi:DUF1707 domain-containing protein [Streptomyces sp. NPDC050610]|uniref:DUF1707 SHOCT-like domain-containing protein n=1 Tax=Streptomyces sp. NPDC050610 TaxID=3157097 RepID=UPI0034479EDC
MSVPVGSLPGVRASTRERDQAVEALTEHVVEGRLTDAEFATRSDKAQSAASRDELLRLFDDLPQPHPVFDAADSALPAPTADRASAPAARSGDSVPAARPDGSAPAKLSGAAAAAVYGMFPAAGVIAVVLMVLTGAWYWLLIVPPVAYGARQVVKKRRRRD